MTPGHVSPFSSTLIPPVKTTVFAAAAGAKEVTVTEGAPGALAALTRTARDNASTFEGCRTRVKFLDWRDDQAALDGEEVVAVETNENGVVNDDAYEYETVADPFLEAVAEVAAKFAWDPKRRERGE